MQTSSKLVFKEFRLRENGKDTYVLSGLGGLYQKREQGQLAKAHPKVRWMI